MTNKELKPCPFCGASHQLALVQRVELSNRDAYRGWVECQRCGANGPRSFVETDGSADKAILDAARYACEGWNTHTGEVGADGA